MLLIGHLHNMYVLVTQILNSILFSSVPSFLLQVSQYTTEGLERARDSLTEAAALRERFVLGTNLSRRVAAAAASAVSI